MFTASIPGVADSASGQMARAPGIREPREDRGSGRLMTFVDREVRYVEDAKGRKRAISPEVAALVPHRVLAVREAVPVRFIR